MNNAYRIHVATILLSSLLPLSQAQAHSPEAHAREAAAANQPADCSKLDHSKMDMADPVARALMAKCPGRAHADATRPMDHTGHAAQPAATPDASGHAGHGEH